MSFPPSVKESALVVCGRSCCICHKFCGIKIECHHIIQEADGGENTLDNCIPLCFDCHADMKSYDNKHPRGTKYTSIELKRHRDSWFEKIKNPAISNYSDGHKSLDREMLKSITSILPWFGPMAFIDENNFGLPFNPEKLNPFDELIGRSSDPGFEFTDPTLEMLRVELCQSVSKFLSKIGLYTSPLHSTNGRLNGIHESDH